MVVTLNRPRAEHRELRIVWEWNPHYRGRLGWWLWSKITPQIVVNRWQ
jgi:hypothetical protein